MSDIVQPVIQSRLNKTLIDKWVFLFRIPEAMAKINKSNVVGKGHVDTNSIQFSLKSVQIPDTTIKAVSQRYASGNLYVSSHSKEPYELLKITFDIDNTFNNYSTIYEWLNLLHDEKEAIPDPHQLVSDNFGLRDYWTSLGIVGLDEYNVTKIMFTFTQAFPTNLSGWNFDYTQDKKIEASANFAFSQMHLSYPENSVLK